MGCFRDLVEFLLTPPLEVLRRQLRYAFRMLLIHEIVSRHWLEDTGVRFSGSQVCRHLPSLWSGNLDLLTSGGIHDEVPRWQDLNSLDGLDVCVVVVDVDLASDCLLDDLDGVLFDDFASHGGMPCGFYVGGRAGTGSEAWREDCVFACMGGVIGNGLSRRRRCGR